MMATIGCPRLNIPAISVRDLVVHNDDLVAGTHGRGFWILDDITSETDNREDVKRRAFCSSLRLPAVTGATEHGHTAPAGACG